MEIMPMKKNLLFIPLIAVLLNITSCKSTPKDAVLLKFNLAKGSKYKFAMDVDMTMNQKNEGKDVNMKNSIATIYDFEVTGDSAGWKTVLSTIGKVGMDMDAMGGKMHFDTDMPADTTTPAGIMAKVFTALKGAKFSFIINDDGEISKVIGVEEMAERMAAGLPHSDRLSESLKGSGFDEESIKQNMQQAFAAYPGKPVKPGDSWSKSMNQKVQGLNVKLHYDFTLESVNGDDAVIKVSSKLSSLHDGAVDGTKVNMGGTSKGIMHYSLATGMTTDATTDMDLTMKVSVQGMDIPMRMNLKTMMKGKKI